MPLADLIPGMNPGVNLSVNSGVKHGACALISVTAVGM